MSSKPALRHGLIVGGMSDGIVNVWDAASLLGGATDGAAIAMIERHSVAVRAVQFNPHPAAQHLIGAASIDGDISIINLESPGQPTVASPMSGGQKLDSEVTSLSWNTSVTHILATATVAGVVVVWDLKENKPWCQLRDPHRASISDVAWAPNDGLYLVTACDDDSRPVLRLWDLRSSTTTPLCEFSGHTKGVLSVDWCPTDPNLLVSCGKDAHTFVWDIQQGRAIAEVPAPSGAPTLGGSGGPLASNAPFGGGGGGGFGSSSGGDTFGAPPGGSGGGGGLFGGGGGGGGPDAAGALFGTTLGGLGAGVGRRYAVRWSKHLPAVFAACSFDRRVTVHGITGIGPGMSARSAYPGAAGQAAAMECTLRRAPRWLRRPVSAVFAFGGKLVTYGTPTAAVRSDLRAGPVPFAKTLNLASVCTDHEFVSRALAFESDLLGIEAGSTDVRAFCERKAEEAAAAAAAGGAVTSSATAATTVWSLMRLLFETDTRAHILAHLGYEPSRIASEVEAYAGPENMVLAKAAAAAAADVTAGVDGVQSTAAAAVAAVARAAVDDSGVGGHGLSGSGGSAWGSASDVFAASRSNGDSAATAADIFGAGAAPPSHEAGSNISSSTMNGPMPNGPRSPPPTSPAAAATAAAAAAGPASPAAFDGPASYVKKRVPSDKDNAMLKRALLVGDFPAAVSACLKQDRLDDALLLSGLGSPELWAATQAEIFRRRASPLMSVMQAVIQGELAGLVNASPLNEWRETLALLCTYAKPDAFGALCEALGDRLAVEAGDAAAAVLPYMCAGAVHKAILIWVQEARAAPSRGEAAGPALHACAEKVLVFRRAVYVLTGGNVPPEATVASPGEASALADFGMMLANEGYLATAATIAARIADTSSSGDDGVPSPGALLRDRLAHAFSRADFASPSAQAISQAPFPLPVMNVGVAPVAAPPTPTPAVPSYEQQHMQQQQQQQPTYDAYGNAEWPAAAAAANAYPAAQGGYAQQQQQAYAQPQQRQQQQPQQLQAGNAPLSARSTGASTGYGQTMQSSQMPQQPQQTYQQPMAQPQSHAGFQQQPAGFQQQPQQQVSQRPPVPQPQSSYGAVSYGTLPGHAPQQQQQQQGQGQQSYGGQQQYAAPAAPATSSYPQQQTQAQTQPGTFPGRVTTFVPQAPQQQQQPGSMHGGAPFGSSHPLQQAAAAAPAPPPPPPVPVNLPISPEMQAAIDALMSTIGALGAAQLNTIEVRQLQEATATMDVLRVSIREFRCVLYVK